MEGFEGVGGVKGRWCVGGGFGGSRCGLATESKVLSWRVGDEIAGTVAMVARGREELLKLGVLGRSFIGRRYGNTHHDDAF